MPVGNEPDKLTKPINTITLVVELLPRNSSLGLLVGTVTSPVVLIPAWLPETAPVVNLALKPLVPAGVITECVPIEDRYPLSMPDPPVAVVRAYSPHF